MKLVIDIPENWENIKFCDVVNREVIKNGISLEDIKAEIKQVSDKELTEEAFDSKWWGEGFALCPKNH